MNAPLHIGQLVNPLQTDIWARFKKLNGKHCHYVFIDKSNACKTIKFRQDFISFGIELDCNTSNAEENKSLEKYSNQEIDQQDTADALPIILTINGLKLSRSRGTLIQVDTYIRHLPPESLRYYFATKLGKSSKSVDLNFKDFLLRVNSDISGKIVHIAARCATVLSKQFNQQLAPFLHDEELLDRFIDESDLIAKDYENCQYTHAMHKIMTMADIANQYLDEHTPWLLISSSNTKREAHLIFSQGINLFRLLIIYLKPVLPVLAKRSEAFLNEADLNWESIQLPLLNHYLNNLPPLSTRINQSNIDSMLYENKSSLH